MVVWMNGLLDEWFGGSGVRRMNVWVDEWLCG